MACEYMFLDSARDELDTIVSYYTNDIKKHSFASKILDELHNKLALICINPRMYGLSRMSELAKLGYRTFYVKDCVVLYFYRDEKIFVAHIFHQRQDYKNLV